MSAAEQGGVEALSIEERVAKIIVDHLCVAVERDGVSPDADLAKDLAADSLDRVELTLAMEDEFDIAVTDDQSAACETVGDWQQLVRQLVEAKP
jgi:acyl carrier protein